jgi:hypothetical protein
MRRAKVEKPSQGFIQDQAQEGEVPLCAQNDSYKCPEVKESNPSRIKEESLPKFRRTRKLRRSTNAIELDQEEDLDRRSFHVQRVA